MSEAYVMVPASQYRRYQPSKEELEMNSRASAALGLGIASFAIAMFTLYWQFCLLALYLIPATFLVMTVFVDWIFFVLYLTSIILGGIAISKGKKAKALGKGRTGKGFGTAGLVISIIFLSLGIVATVLYVLLDITVAVIILIFYIIIFIIGMSGQASTALALLAL